MRISFLPSTKVAEMSKNKWFSIKDKRTQTLALTALALTVTLGVTYANSNRLKNLFKKPLGSKDAPPASIVNANQSSETQTLLKALSYFEEHILPTLEEIYIGLSRQNFFNNIGPEDSKNLALDELKTSIAKAKKSEISPFQAIVHAYLINQLYLECMERKGATYERLNKLHNNFINQFADKLDSSTQGFRLSNGKLEKMG